MPKVYEVTCDGDSNFYSTKREALAVARDFASTGDIVRVFRLSIQPVTLPVLINVLNQRGYAQKREQIAYFADGKSVVASVPNQ